jgi:hypothetical protein
VADLFSQYEAGEESREKVVRWVLIVIAAVALLWAVDWVLTTYGTFNMRDMREQYRAHHFFRLLSEKQYQAAYRLWGCDPAKPCRDYSLQKFMEDWGPQSPAADVSKEHVHAVRHCKTGIIEVIDFGGDPLNLWVESKDLTLSFAPWPVCTPHWQPPPSP